MENTKVLHLDADETKDGLTAYTRRALCGQYVPSHKVARTAVSWVAAAAADQKSVCAHCGQCRDEGIRLVANTPCVSAATINEDIADMTFSAAFVANNGVAALVEAVVYADTVTVVAKNGVENGLCADYTDVDPGRILGALRNALDALLAVVEVTDSVTAARVNRGRDQ